MDPLASRSDEDKYVFVDIHGEDTVSAQAPGDADDADDGRDVAPSMTKVGPVVAPAHFADAGFWLKVKIRYDRDGTATTRILVRNDGTSSSLGRTGDHRVGDEGHHLEFRVCAGNGIRVENTGTLAVSWRRRTSELWDDFKVGAQMEARLGFQFLIGYDTVTLLEKNELTATGDRRPILVCRAKQVGDGFEPIGVPVRLTPEDPDGEIVVGRVASDQPAVKLVLRGGRYSVSRTQASFNRRDGMWSLRSESTHADVHLQRDGQWVFVSKGPRYAIRLGNFGVVRFSAPERVTVTGLVVPTYTEYVMYFVGQSIREYTGSADE